jgi:tetratricopeptide (TPR) repeat protein
MSTKPSGICPSAPPPAASTDLIVSALILIFTVVLYTAWLLNVQWVVGQFHKYPDAALRFLQGGMDPERLLDYSPVYLGLCVLIAKYLNSNFQTLLWLQVLLVALTAAALFLALRRHFGRAISLCGAAAFLLNPGVLIYVGVYEPEPVMMALLALLVLFAGMLRPSGGAAAGGILAICMLTRPTFALLALLVPVYFWLNMDGRRRVATIALFLFPIVAGLPFLAYRGIAMTGSFPPPLMDPGVSFFMGNNPLSGSTTPEFPPLVIEVASEFPGEVDYDHAVYRLVARRDSPAPLNHAGVNRLWASRATNFIRDEPFHLLRQVGRKLFFLFHSHRWHDLAEAHTADRLLPWRRLAFVPMSLVASLALVGLAVGLPRWRSYFLYYVAFFSQAVAMLATYTAVERLRLSLLPFFIVFAVIGLDWFLRNFKSRSIAVPILLLPLILFSSDSDLMRDNSRNWDNYVRQSELQEETYRLRDALKFSEAATALARSYATAPWLEPFGIRPAGLPVPAEGLPIAALREFPVVRGEDPTSRLDRAMLLMEAGELDEAERVLVRLHREGHAFNRIINRPAQPAYYLGRIAALRGRHAEAVVFMQDALVQAPGDPAILAQLTAVTGEARYSDVLRRYFGDLNALFFLASAHMENGHPAEAATLLRRLVDRLPEYWKGKILLAAALADAGRDKEAVAAYLDAMRKRPEPVMFPEKIVPAFRRQAERSTAGGEAWYRYALSLRQSGRYVEAREVLKKTLAAAATPVVRQELSTVEETIRRAGLE